MSDLITLAQYKALTNTTGSENDALLATLISAASAEVERFCDRSFALSTQVQELVGPTASPLEYPVNKVLYVGRRRAAAEAANVSATTGYSLDVDGSTLTVSDDAFDSEEYQLDGSTLDELAALVQADYADLTLAVDPLATNNAMLLSRTTLSLPPGGMGTLVGAERGGLAKLEDGSFVGSPGTVVAYEAGYAAIPGDLQRAVANVVKDMLGVQLGTTNPNVKSFTITNYSEVLADGTDLRAIVQSHSDELAGYRRVNI